jgi:hypothetical protein
MTTTTTFSYKWAYISYANTRMQYTSTTNIPIWNKEKLISIKVTNSLSKRSYSVPIPTDTSTSINLHEILYNYQIWCNNDEGRKPQTPEYMQIGYIRVNGSRTISWDYDERYFDVEYTYNLNIVNKYDKKNGVPLQLLFGDYSYSNLTELKGGGFTADELYKAGVPFSKLNSGGYDIEIDLFPILFNLSGFAEFQTKYNSHKSLAETLQNNNAVLTKEKDVLNATITSLKNTYENDLRTYQSLQESSQLLTDKNSELKKDIEGKDEFIKSLQAQLDNDAETKATMQSDYDSLNNNYNELQTIKYELDIKIDNLSSDKTSLTNQKDVLDQQILLLTKDNESKSSQISRLQNRNNELTSDATFNNEERNELNDNIASLQETNASLERNVMIAGSLAVVAPIVSGIILWRQKK